MLTTEAQRSDVRAGYRSLSSSVCAICWPFPFPSELFMFSFAFYLWLLFSLAGNVLASKQRRRVCPLTQVSLLQNYGSSWDLAVTRCSHVYHIRCVDSCWNVVISPFQTFFFCYEKPPVWDNVGVGRCSERPGEELSVFIYFKVNHFTS